MKKIIREEIFLKYFDSVNHDILFSDLPKDIREADIIEIERCEDDGFEGYYSGTHSSLAVFRDREETDKEYTKRINEINANINRLKESRLKQYLELKKEFEP